MKRFFVALMVLFSFSTVAMACGDDDKKVDDQVIIYFFHRDNRCENCVAMENSAREVIEKKFKDELKSCVVEYKVLNMDNEENKHYVSEYKLFSDALVFTLIKDGKEIKNENLMKAWALLYKKEKFEELISETVNSYIAEL